jgi:hypothetical protein
VINSCPSSFGGGHYDNHFRLFIDGNYAKTFGESNMSRTIVSTAILVEWSDKPKMETLLHEMPDDLRQSFDEWLSDIEEEQIEDC